MRAALVNRWPALSEMFGIHPWDIGRLSAIELQAYLEALEQAEDEVERSRREADAARRNVRR